MDEKVIFEQGNVKITNARFVVGDKTTAINGVNSISSRILAPSRMFPVIILLVGLAILFGADGAGKLIGIAIVGIAGWFLYNQKPTHFVVLVTSSGAVDALDSKDEPFIRSVISALNDALVHRG
jgi:Family of unknown function (DUF6232)